MLINNAAVVWPLGRSATLDPNEWARAIAISQLNRGPEQRTDERPMLSDLRESGSLEQDADMVILVHRPDTWESDDPRGGEADLIIAKHRAGPTATISVAHQLHYPRFTDLAR